MGSEGAGLAEVVPWPARLAYGVAIATGVWVVVPKAWYSLRNVRPDMNLLMTIAVAGAVALGEWLEERGQETHAVHDRLEAMARSGQTIVVVGNETHVCGLIAVADRGRPESVAAVAALKRAGVAPIVMLTGDNRGTAEVVGREVGVDEVRAEFLPEDKVRAVEELERDHGPTAMIGDGVNDAPALARSTLGVAMGAAGTDAAIEPPWRSCGTTAASSRGRSSTRARRSR